MTAKLDGADTEAGDDPSPMKGTECTAVEKEDELEAGVTD